MLVINFVAAQPLQRFYVEREALGSKGSITCYALDSTHAQRVMNKAFATLDSFDNIFSDYKPDSEVMTMASSYQPRKPNPVSSPLFDLCLKSETLRDQTSGSFNIAVGALTQLWRSYLKADKIPGRCAIRKAKKTLKPRHLKLKPDGRTIVFGRSAMSLDFGGIAKGYIADHMGHAMSKEGITSYLINLGGDLVAGDPPPGKESWSISVSWCQKEIYLKNNAVATSGPNYQFFVHKGVRYAHIIDPVTGWGIKDFFSTTVIAPTGWQADAFASAFSIMDVKASLSLANDLNKIEVIMGKSDNIYYSNNFVESKFDN